jgi:uncharacterized membrane protein YgcG
MINLSPHGRLLLMYCAGVTAYFVVACSSHWPSPFDGISRLGDPFANSGSGSFSSSGGSSYSRSSGGSWGGGK